MIGLTRGTVQIVSYRPAWKRLYEIEAKRLHEVVGCHALKIEHVGSTAIEGMDAKPIIDILIAVEDLDDACEIVPFVETFGYAYKMNDDVPGRVFFVKGPPRKRTHHLSLTALNSAYWKDNLAFRDYVRAHPDAAQAYVRLKRRLAEQFSNDRGSYTAGKKSFVANVVELAREGIEPGQDLVKTDA